MGRRKVVSKREGEGDGSKRKRTSSNPKEDGVKEAKEKSTGGRKAAEISKPGAAANSADEGGIIHPLLIPHVLDKIFQHIICPKTDDENEGSSELSTSVAKNVKNLRLVCKQWRESATHLFRRNSGPRMSFTEKLGSFSSSKMQDFLDVMKSSDLIPNGRYAFISDFFQTKHQQLMKDFMRICGPVAVELHLSWDVLNSMKFTRESFPDLNLKGLKKLTFHATQRRIQIPSAALSKMSEIVYLIETILSSAEKLQEFQFHQLSNPQAQWSRAMIQQFVERISKRIPKTVKTLRLRMALNDLQLNTLAESELKLEELHLYVPCEASSMAIRKFFESQAPTLKVLKICGRIGFGSLPSPLDFPRFHELLHLELKVATIQQFSWPETFPKLKTLNMVGLETESTVELFTSSGQEGLSVNELHLPYHYLEAPLVKMASQCFPNISKLHIAPSSKDISTFQEVFVNFPNVEELYVSFVLYDQLNADSVFSGVSKQDCRRIMKAGNFDNVKLRDVQHQPSFLNLTKLKKLVLKIGDFVTLTDFTAHFVFLKMASLKELHTHRFQMSEKCLGLLREKFTLKLY